MNDPINIKRCISALIPGNHEDYEKYSTGVLTWEYDTVLTSLMFYNCFFLQINKEHEECSSLDLFSNVSFINIPWEIPSGLFQRFPSSIWHFGGLSVWMMLSYCHRLASIFQTFEEYVEMIDLKYAVCGGIVQTASIKVKAIAFTIQKQSAEGWMCHATRISEN